MPNDNSEFLKKGEGKLASDYHKDTKYSEKRKEKIIKEQLEREKNVDSSFDKFFKVKKLYY